MDGELYAVYRLRFLRYYHRFALNYMQMHGAKLLLGFVIISISHNGSPRDGETCSTQHNTIKTYQTTCGT